MDRSLVVKGFEFIVISTSGALSLQELGVGGINVEVIVDVSSEVSACGQTNGMSPCY